MTRPLYIPTQPQRCAGGETGAAGACLACGARQEQLCQADASKRPRAKRKPRA